ncbi:hypothetical protein [Nocardioides jishulii]|uniref:Uncharacterized protein n=1 Tax=Nocardioides jishulii TaxID=2575440 RepID=A0A4U2YWS3_9ACTN|nr:hypothetical protein [Nocardioides jishulii]QCX28486.1 hypothetical protein FCL41_13840 [Nocardioides jishulii]TKI64621.1 hypothetical protein FC770_05735 [Nocardioides jishulii]
MPSASVDLPLFIPAESQAEAVARLFHLTGAPPQGRGEKRAVVALRDALGLDIDISATNATMAHKIADELKVDWSWDYVVRNKVNLHGLNALLEGATWAVHEGRLSKVPTTSSPELHGAKWAAFEPARSKIEAVNRISALTGSGPERLGPGSKEHKRVLVNLATHLAPHLDTRLSKTKLAAALAYEFDAPWNDQCESTGETISLRGLNVLLAGAERRLGKLGKSHVDFTSPAEEGQALASALVDVWRSEKQADGTKRVRWDALKSIQWMVDQGVTNGPNQSEWQGFYFEARGKAALNEAFTPREAQVATRFANTDFDYSLNFLWDLKAHTSAWWSPQTQSEQRSSPDSILNDKAAMELAVAAGGLGFLMVSGRAVSDDDGTFTQWHRDFKARQGKTPRSSNSGKSRRRKAAFEPSHIDVFFVPDVESLLEARERGVLKEYSQGRQPRGSDGSVGAPRPPKYSLNTAKAQGTQWHMARVEW